MSRGRRIWLPVAMSLAMLGLTVSLGFWQLQRLAWKTALIRDIDQGEVSPPVPLSAETGPFRLVYVDGHFLPGLVRYGVEVRQGPAGPVMGSQAVAALAWAGGEPVIVDRGWVPADAPVPETGQPVRIQGYVRAPEHTPPFGAPDDPVARRFFALDPVAIGASLGLSHVLPLTVVAMGPPSGPLVPATSLPRPPNDHLSYAITWFGLSAALVVVVLVYLRQQYRPERAR